MALVKHNQVTKGVSGKFGDDIVFKQLGKRTIFSARPRKASVVSEKMKAHRERFRKATRYAKLTLADPLLKAEYETIAREREIASAFAAAVGDYLKAPEISSVTTDTYTGQIGGIISIEASDAFKLTAVKVTISQNDGTVLESGDATLTPGSHEWKYVATVSNASLAGTKVKVQALDRPGNDTMKEITL